MPDESPELTEPADSGTGDFIFYDSFPMVPSYHNVDPAAVAEYKQLLVAAGFTRSGTVRDTLQSYNMEYYSNGNIHVAIGQPKRSVYVRIVETELSTEPTANELRAF